MRAAVANGLVTWPKREMPPTIASTFSSVIARCIAVLAWARSTPISTRTSSYWYFVPLRSDLAVRRSDPAVLVRECVRAGDHREGHQCARDQQGRATDGRLL